MKARWLVATLRQVIALGVLVGAPVATMAAEMYFVDDVNDFLRRVDTGTLAVTAIGPLGVGGDFGDMAYDATTSTMFYVGGRFNNALYTLDLSTGAASLVGSHGIDDMFGLGVDDTGALFAQNTSGNFYGLDKTTGAATLLGGNSVYPGGFTWDSVNSRVVLIEAGSGSVYSVDRSNGATTPLADTGYINDCDIAYDAAANEYFALDWDGNLYQYDSAFNRTTLGGGFARAAAVEIINGTVPEPVSVAVFGVGALTLALVRRWRR